eukprot:CAMPEP_0113819010 /NCGR_PEP_ID=MMETSP0328-20130328/526_1 /TAXON_ID=39455 /ORGANISM="Alexandrium minutum" /LENGTH=154 /DNA_ID=CAMNT_0000786945 /DNA_START=674 /DNA_END=1138 /DNA_ORIENTATION=+ /assembly_acc=CAM_ASM_000350
MLQPAGRAANVVHEYRDVLVELANAGFDHWIQFFGLVGEEVGHHDGGLHTERLAFSCDVLQGTPVPRHEHHIDASLGQSQSIAPAEPAARPSDDGPLAAEGLEAGGRPEAVVPERLRHDLPQLQAREAEAEPRDEEAELTLHQGQVQLKPRSAP